MKKYILPLACAFIVPVIFNDSIALSLSWKNWGYDLRAVADGLKPHMRRVTAQPTNREKTIPSSFRLLEMPVRTGR